MLIDGNITLDQWQGSVRSSPQSFRTFRRLCWVVVVGLVWALREYGVIGQKLRAEYGYLQRFAGDIMAGRVSAPMALARVQLYAESVRSSYWQGSSIRQQRQGYSMMRRVLDSQAAHCDDCLRYAAMGT